MKLLDVERELALGGNSLVGEISEELCTMTRMVAISLERNELSGMLKEGMEHPSTKPVLTGAAVGAVGAMVLPVITWPVGLAAGAGFMLYQRIKR